MRSIIDELFLIEGALVTEAFWETEEKLFNEVHRAIGEVRREVCSEVGRERARRVSMRSV